MTIDDRPPKTLGVEMQVVQQVSAQERAVMACEACRCERVTLCLPLDRAKFALRGNGSAPLSAESVLAFREDLSEQSQGCEFSYVSLEAFRETLEEYSGRVIWGRERNQTLEEYVCSDVLREFGFSHEVEDASISLLVTDIIDSALGRKEGRKSYDPCITGKSGGVMSYPNYVKYRLRLRLQRNLQNAYRYESVDAPDRRAGLEEDLGEAPGAEQDSRLDLLHYGLDQVANILVHVKELELKLIEIIEQFLPQAGLTEKKQKLRAKALLALKRAVNGDPGHCIVFDGDLFDADDTPFVPLGMHITRDVGLFSYGVSNAAVFQNQVIQWADDLLGRLAAVSELSFPAQELVRGIINWRRSAFMLASSLSSTLSLLAPGREQKLLELWQGPPHRDLRDAENGKHGGVAGIGIAHLPFLFGLIDPMGAETAGLDSLLGNNCA